MMSIPSARKERTVGLVLSLLKPAWAGTVVRAEVATAPGAAKNTARDGAILRVLRARGAPGSLSTSKSGGRAMGIIAEKTYKERSLLLALADLGKS
jgi:hypothetical protein